MLQSMAEGRKLLKKGKLAKLRFTTPDSALIGRFRIASSLTFKAGRGGGGEARGYAVFRMVCPKKCLRVRADSTLVFKTRPGVQLSM